jgi:D-alanyl-D-alanine carboxypeptidase
VEAGAPGIMLEIRGPDGTELLTSGRASIETGRPMQGDDLFRIASVTKTFTGALVMMLVADGALSLDDTVDDLVPGLLKHGGRLTVRQLLAHTSGLPDYTKTDGFAERASSGASLTPQQVLGFVADRKLLFQPDSEYRYSDTDNIVLGLIIEAVTGNSFEDELRSRIFDPLGLERTTLATSFRYPRPHLEGYQFDADSGELDNVTDVQIDPNGAWASGAIISTVGDVSSFFGALFRGELVPGGLLAQMMVTVPGGGSPLGPGTNNAGLGVFGWTTSCGEVWGHTGSWPGYRILGAASPDGSSSLAMVVNAANPPDELDAAILHAQELAACRALAAVG